MRDLFISYRRPLAKRGRCLAEELAVLLLPRWSEEGKVVFDEVHVKNEETFATDLVDDGLNQCIAMVAIIDDAWLDQSSLGRLGPNDWVTYELNHAVRHNCVLLLVGTGSARSRFRALKLPKELAALNEKYEGKVFTWFIWDDDQLLDEQARRLATQLLERVKDHQRLPSEQKADDRHNKPRVVSVEDAESKLPQRNVLHYLLAAAEARGRLFFRVGELSLVFVPITFVFMRPFWYAAFPLAISLACLLLWRFGPIVRARYVEHTLVAHRRPG